MGLISCSECKKLYSYEKYYGICPKCGRYNRESTAADEHQKLHDKYDGGYIHTEQMNSQSRPQNHDTGSSPHKLSDLLPVKTRAFWILLLLFVNPVLVFIAYLIYSITKKKKK